MAEEKDLTHAPHIITVRGLMLDINTEIENIKNGTLKEGDARQVARLRATQMKGVELYLQAARMDHALRRTILKEVGMTIDTKPLEATSEPVAPPLKITSEPAPSAEADKETK